MSVTSDKTDKSGRSDNSWKTYLHYLISAYILFGGAFSSNCTYLKWHVAFNGFVIVHWLTNNNRCVLSDGYEEDTGYTRHVLNTLGFPINKDDKATMMVIAYAAVVVPMLWSARKVSKICK